TSIAARSSSSNSCEVCKRRASYQLSEPLDLFRWDHATSVPADLQINRVTIVTNHNRIAWLVVGAIVLLAAWKSLERLQDGRLFLFRRPFDREPSGLETRDAAATARQWTLPALLFLAIASLALMLTLRTGPGGSTGVPSRRHRGSPNLTAHDQT